MREEVCDIYIGGNQMCEKWLKDRKPKKDKPERTLRRRTLRITIAEWSP